MASGTHSEAGAGDIELRITKAADGSPGYAVHLSAPGRPPVSVELGSLEEPGTLAKAFERGAGEADREHAGECLYTALLGGALAEEWLSATASQAAPRRACLEVEPPELRSLPWELLRHRGRWLWRQPETLWRRGCAVGPRTDDPSSQLGPLRVLVVICTPPQDERLLAEQELAAISGALERSPGRTYLEVLDVPANAAVLAERIDRLRPHVVHYIGHGMPRPGRGSPVLVFTPAETRHAGPATWELEAGAVADLTVWKPLLVVLNACHSGRADPADWVGGMAQAFLDAGSRAVVSMQDDITSDCAVTLSRTFYERLGADQPVDTAVAAARSELARRAPKSGAWALPVLLTCEDPRSVLPITFAPPPTASVQDILRYKQYVDLGRFVGRTDERRQAWWALDDPGQATDATDRPVLVISGHSQANFAKTGKSWLTNWCLITWFLRGHRVVSVNLAAQLTASTRAGDVDAYPRHKDWLTALRLIRQEATSPEQLCPLPAQAFGEFNAVVNHLVEAPVLPNGTLEPADDEGRRFNDEIGDPRDGRKERIVGEFLHALQKASDGRPLVLALDHAESVMQGAFTQVLYKSLVRPVAYGQAPPLRLILVAPDSWVGGALPESDSHMITRVRVGDFDSAQFMRLARLYQSRLRVQPDETVVKLLEALQQTLDQHFNVELFAQLVGIVPQWGAAHLQEAGR
ncbi:CHAT domain-containing protein [Streptomyces sp. NPDC059371]|uniref:CHAT domain-containing protein n=1 Tax=Streptomyces sp. NPDC059371 TaxID=3346812 RepID=UPI00369159CF